VNVNLYSRNTPAAFWKLQMDPQPDSAQWAAAVDCAASILPHAAANGRRDISHILFQTLGEGQFGAGHWTLSAARRAYYTIKPLLSRSVITLLRRTAQKPALDGNTLGWPFEPRYAEFQRAVLAQIMLQANRCQTNFIDFWPHGKRMALVLTHDIETARGQAFASRLADLEERMGFRSSFNFVPEWYPLDYGLMEDLHQRGFEIGVHGCKHDGKMFDSWPQFQRAAKRINQYLRDFGAVGFRSPLTHRHPVWMQALHVDYDLSFFDTDPYEPIPGGTMSLWPFELGSFIELPYTLPQDYTLLLLLQEKTPRLWLEKVDFIARYHGMALVNSHPDYLEAPQHLSVYEGFLSAMQQRRDYWHALPRAVADWWRSRMACGSPANLPGATLGRASLNDGVLKVYPGAWHLDQAKE
jgi:peptidoglycan/xylan/chitin deacetylase (PgdA/CDA1 family)